MACGTVLQFRAGRASDGLRIPQSAIDSARGRLRGCPGYVRAFSSYVGLQAREAATGEEALELAYARIPDLILLDMSLPGIDGWEVTAELKRNAATKHIPIVALTAHALQTERQRTERAGCDGFLAKPCAPPDLLAEIARLLGPRKASGGSSPS